LLLLYVVSILIGRAVRAGVYVIWRLGVDPERRLAPLGTLIQVGLCFLVTMAAFQQMVVVAPLATFVHVVVASPVLLWLFAEPTINGFAGLSILFRRSFAEGDHIILDSGQTGQVRQIRLTTTVARTEEGGRILIPNRRLLHGVTSVDRRQAGVRLSLRFRVEAYPSEAVISRIKALLLLSPYRAAGSSVTAEHDA
jgi:small-conductance mechanosensitive channel